MFFLLLQMAIQNNSNQSLTNKTGGIVILDFGSQYNQLIARRVRELGVYAEILPYYTPIDKILTNHPKGIILSGGPSSVYADDANTVPAEIYQLNIPIFGICYGMQLTAFMLGGTVSKGQVGEYGKAIFHKETQHKLLQNVPDSSTVWMSHFDEVTQLPKGFSSLGHTDTCIAGFYNDRQQIYATQFHPEVHHTEFGAQIIKNFVFDICHAESNWNLSNYIDKTIQQIKEEVGTKKVVLGLSGGVDSSVAAMLIHKAIGKQLTCIFVDTGLLRKDEGKAVMETYGKHYQMNIVMVNAQDRFLSSLQNISDPEEKRKIIGKAFIDVFDEEAKKIKDVTYLAQGTIYPDIIESQSAKGGPSATIKSHHNVGGLPKKMHLKLLEPLKELFKDEVRQIGLSLGIPEQMIMRHPFPGPGLGIRILGAVSPEKVHILQQADAIFIEELRKHNLYQKVSQAFVVLLPVKSVGIMGDERTYEYTAVVRSANTTDFMTATWSRLPYDFLEIVSSRIINEVKGINRVTYDISSKPPATIEWE